MSKRQLFTVKNSEWTIRETASDIFELRYLDGTRIGGLRGKRLASALAVIAELARHLASKAVSR